MNADGLHIDMKRQADLSVEPFISRTSEQTYDYGRSLGEAAGPGTVIALHGELGAGKTVLAQGIAAGLGIKGPVPSPTFTIVRVYDTGRLPLYHFDAYRIADPCEMDEISFDDYFCSAAVCVVEWPERIADLIPASATHIYIDTRLSDPCWRQIRIENPGD